MNLLKQRRLWLFLFFFITGGVFGADGVSSSISSAGVVVPTTVAECMQVAETAWKHDDFNTAIVLYLQVLKLDPKNWQALQNLGGCYFRLGKIAEAKAAYKECLAINPGDTDVNDFVVQRIPTNTPTPTPGPMYGQFSLGAYFDTWNTNYGPAQATNGEEILFPMSMSYILWKDVVVYAQSEFANGNYDYLGYGNLYLTAFSDTTAGAEVGFQTLGLNSELNVWFNIPTGDSAWESQTDSGNIPEEFAGDRYQGRGLGISGIYAISIPDGKSKFGLAGGYIYSGDYNPNAGVAAAVDLKLGDSIFCSLNRVTDMGSNQTEVIQSSAFFFLPSLENSVNDIWSGPNINFSYAWNNPTAFSFELGAQVFLPNQTASNGQFIPDSTYSYGPRIYFNPSYTFGDFTLTARLKYVLPNGYDPSNLDYDGGGYLAGIEPSFKFNMGKGEYVKVLASYTYVDAQGSGFDINNNRVDILYNWFAGSINYVFPF